MLLMDTIDQLLHTTLEKEEEILLYHKVSRFLAMKILITLCQYYTQQINYKSWITIELLEI